MIVANEEKKSSPLRDKFAAINTKYTIVNKKGP